AHNQPRLRMSVRKPVRHQRQPQNQPAQKRHYHFNEKPQRQQHKFHVAQPFLAVLLRSTNHNRSAGRSRTDRSTTPSQSSHARSSPPSSADRSNPSPLSKSCPPRLVLPLLPQKYCAGCPATASVPP